MSPTHSREARQEKEVSELNLWAKQWRAERIKRARDELRMFEAAFSSLKNQATDYAVSLRLVRDTCAQVLAVWESSPSGLTGGEEATPDLQNCPECGNSYLAIRTDVYKDGREFVYCDCCGCIADRRFWNRIVPLARSFAGEDRDYPLQDKESDRA